MNSHSPCIAVDSNCLSYVIDALEGIVEPVDPLAKQRIALVRVFFYGTDTLWTLPTVKQEFEQISDPVRRGRHLSWTNVRFGVLPLRNAGAVLRRAETLAAHHRGERDRLILAEAEDVGCTALLSFDADFVRNLAPHTHLKLMEPVPFWAWLGVQHGAPLRNQPVAANPLAPQGWWRW